MELKIAILIVVTSVTTVFATDTYSQVAKVSLDMENKSLEQVMDEIERQSEFYFIFNQKQIDVNRVMDIQAENMLITDILPELFEGTNVNYLVLDRKILLTTDPLEDDLLTIASETGLQQRQITGKVTDEKNNPLPGVNVTVKGTTLGTITDVSGNYAINNAPQNATLVFSFIGMTAQEIPSAGRMLIDVVLKEEAIGLEEVVVTALGISRQSKSLVYATQSVKASLLTEVRDPDNILNSFQGKVANALITQSSGGVGSDARIILRGNRSIQGNNSAMIVVDGVPNNSANINPDDIESVTILRGASAAALYGSQAGNGVMVITTKKGKPGEVEVTVNSGIKIESPFSLPKVQNIYGQGNGGILNPSIGSSWGDKMTGQQYTNIQGNDRSYSAQPNNINDFFRRGTSLNNSIGISGGTEKAQTYLSYTNNKVQGIFPNNDLMNNTVNLRLSNKISKRLSTDAKVTYSNQNIKNIPRSSEGNTPIMDIYQIPRNVSSEDAENYSVTNAIGVPVPAPWSSTLQSIYGNPYWEINNDVLKENETQMIGLLSAKYQIMDWLSLTGRANIDRVFTQQERSTYAGTLLWATRPGGYYSKSMTTITQQWYDVILAGNNSITEDIKANYNIGAILQDNRYDQTNAIADGLNVTNKFNLGFATTPQISANSTAVQTQAVFGQVNFSFKNYLFLDGSLRNDWDSRLPAPHSFMYYSVGLSDVISEMVQLPKSISYLKANINYAEVGNGGQFGLLSSTYSYEQGTGNGYLSRSLTLPIPGLKPEIVKSLEAGIEAKFFNDRLGFNITIYKSNSFNQLLTISLPTATGYSRQYINAGNIQNKGIELVLHGSPVKQKDFSWDVDFNLAFNRNTVIELSDNLKVVYLGGFVDFGARPQVAVNGSYGDLFAYQWEKDANGNYVVTSSGTPLTTNVAGKVPGYIGNFNPKATLGLTNSFIYKKVSLRVLIDGRVGGVMVSGTEQNLAFDGITEGTLPYREGNWNLGGVNSDGQPVSATISAQDFWRTASGKRYGTGEFFAYDATCFRVREVSLGYGLPLNSNSFVKSARLSLVSRNLLWLFRGSSIMDIPGLKKRKMWFDPDMSLYNGNNFQGVEYGAFPSTRSIGVNLNLTF